MNTESPITTKEKTRHQDTYTKTHTNNIQLDGILDHITNIATYRSYKDKLYKNLIIKRID